MWYEINVSLNGKHLFATGERSITSKSALGRALPILKQKFPVGEGYKIDVTQWETTGKRIVI
jgi:hypothetical protein